MSKDNQWLLMTYYCPTYGMQGKSEPLQLTGRDMNKFKSKLTDKTHLDLTQDS